MTGERVVVDFPTKNEEHARRILVEAQRLANLTPGEWLLWLDASALRLGVPPSDLAKLVKATIQDREKQAREQKAEERREEQRAKQRRSDQQREERERQRQQDSADQEAQRKHRQKEKEFANLVKLPVEQREPRIDALAKVLGDDPAVLREEFAAFAGGTPIGDLLPPPPPATPSTWNVEPWDEPVDVAALLQELDGNSPDTSCSMSITARPRRCGRR